MGYPLVPGYESVGRVSSAGPESGFREGQRVFVPGAKCFKDVRGLFGGAASRIVVPGQRATPVDERWGEKAVLLALAATAQHALGAGPAPDLIVGHGVLGRLLARLCLLAGGETPTVWETRADRRTGADGYRVIAPDRGSTRATTEPIYDVSGDSALLDQSDRTAGAGRRSGAGRVLRARRSASRSRQRSCGKPASGLPRNGAATISRRS